METKTKTGIVVGLVTVVLVGFLIGVLYQAMVVIPQNEIDAKERQAEADRLFEIQQGVARESAYNSCISTAWNTYSNNWDNRCELRGEEADCSLYTNDTTQLNATHAAAKADCLSIYKAN